MALIKRYGDSPNGAIRVAWKWPFLEWPESVLILMPFNGVHSRGTPYNQTENLPGAHER